MTNPVREMAGHQRGSSPTPGDSEPGSANGGGAARDVRSRDAGPPPPSEWPAPADPNGFTSLLFGEPTRETSGEEREDRSFASDLNLDQIVAAIAGDREERDLITTLLYHHLNDMDTVHYRHEVFRDLEDPALLERVRHFADLMRKVRSHLVQVKQMQYHYEREGWFLDAAAIYCEAVVSLAHDLGSAKLGSRALLAFREFLTAYVTSSAFASLSADTRDRKDALAQIRYCIRIRGGRVDVSRYEGQPDYSAEVLKTFERFKQGAVKDYRVKYRTWPGMDHVGAQILQLVTRLFSEEFSPLDDYCSQHAGFLDETVQRFERELRFYLAYLDYIAPLRSAGLSFCYPDVTADSKEIFATDTFDLALARKLVSEGKPVIQNEFHLAGPERIFVVSGPNQGGKTTFARTFGQLHHLAGVGVPVPGRAARLFLYDRLFTHFEREEDLTMMSGKLEDDLVRIREVLHAATSNSIVIMNEIFTSTTLADARFLGKKVMEKIIQLDLLCVYVTFVDELASLGESVVSMVSTIVPENPAERTYKVVRGPADGLAYALAIAEKYNVTYERLLRRVLA
jgi:DNA mismatch repair protein MutS